MMGHQPQNFALLLIEEQNGRFMNSQMTRYFEIADMTLCDMLGNDEGFMWDELDMDVIAELSIEEIESDYNEYCSGRLEIREF
jgi:hypothetical protein